MSSGTTERSLGRAVGKRGEEEGEGEGEGRERRLPGSFLGGGSGFFGGGRGT